MNDDTVDPSALSPEPTLMIVGPKRRGHPTKHGVRADQFLVLRITNDHKEGLKQIARDEGRPLAAIVKDAIDEYVGDYRERRIFSTQKGNYKPE